MGIRDFFTLVNSLSFAAVTGPALIASVVVFYLYRVDRIPGLRAFHVFLLLAVFRILDVLTLLWIANGGWVAEETNTIYQLLAAFVPHGWAVGVSWVLVSLLLVFGFWALWKGRMPERVVFALASAITSAQILGILLNLTFGVGSGV
ncbi:hypothetical protein GTO10_06955 [Candidatus Saccharibacteria bacterium]|nr:hypothetical protein [Candidatus Saccharibacteria bacterium]